MSDIFLSYSAKDRDRARRLADRLQAAGWSVWWDRRIPAGRTWRSVLAQELETMRCMVVLWSADSVISDWVCEEATEGRQLGKLVPVAIDSVRPPAGFRELQAADLVGWDGAADFAGLQQLLDDIGRLIGPPMAPAAPAAAPPAVAPATPPATPLATTPAAVPAPTPAPAPTPPTPRWRWAAAAVVLLVASTGAWLQKSAPMAPITQPVPAANPTPAAAPAAVPATAQSASPASSLAHTPADTSANANPEANTVTSTQQPAPRVRMPRPARLPPVSAEPTNPRCSALLERAALGEALSADAQAFLRQECRP